jgi:hypothetical protein
MSPHLALVPFLQSWKQLQLAVRLFSYSKQGGLYSIAAFAVLTMRLVKWTGTSFTAGAEMWNQMQILAQRASQRRRFDALLTLITTANETIALPRVTDLSTTPL